MTHSPAPWAYFISASSKYVIKSSGKTFASIYFTKSNQKKSEANARLIAASPILLEALQAIVNSTDYGANDERPLMQAARAAIAKATQREGAVI